MACFTGIDINAWNNCRIKLSETRSYEKRAGTCGSVDSVKNAIAGEVSVYIFNEDKDANYFLSVNINGSDKRYRVIANPASDWGFIPTDLPSGLYDNCKWIVSGCTKLAGGGEADINGPTVIAIN